MRNFTVVTENPATGGGRAYTKYVIGADPVGANLVAAQLIALHQYFICAANTTVVEILEGAGVSGPTLPLPFPTVPYATLAVSDSNLVAMTDYGVSFGLGTLAVAGSGAVISRRSATAGRSGRGRLTTPWLGSRAVTDIGELDATDAATILAGCTVYLDGDDTPVPGATSVNLQEQVAGAGGPYPIVARSISPLLGRLRSRRQ